MIASVVVALLGCGVPCHAETVAQVDLSHAATEPVEYYVVLCARESRPWGTGHAFVVWVKRDRRTGAVDSRGFGFYPQAQRIVVQLFARNGAVHDESTMSESMEPSSLTHRLIMRLDRDTFEASWNVKERWTGSNGSYHLLNRNCTHFTSDVMRAIRPGIPAPAIGERPAAYVGRLMTLGAERAGGLDAGRATPSAAR